MLSQSIRAYTGLHKTNRSHKDKDKYNTMHASSSCTKFFGKSNPLLISCVWLAHWADRWMIEQLQEFRRNNLCNNFVSVASLWQDYCNTCNDSGHHRFFASHPCQSVDSASIWCQKSREPEKLTSDDGHWTRVQKTTQKDCLICNNSADKITRIRWQKSLEKY